LPETLYCHETLVLYARILREDRGISSQTYFDIKLAHLPFERLLLVVSEVSGEKFF
jgi:hypothetical protein